MNKFGLREQFAYNFETALQNAGMQYSYGVENKPKFWRGMTDNNNDTLFLWYSVENSDNLENADNSLYRQELYIGGRIYTRNGFEDTDFQILAESIENECKKIGIFVSWTGEGIDTSIDTESPIYYVDFEALQRLKLGKQPSQHIDLITKTITENGTYNAVDDNADGYSRVKVNVELNTATKSITENGTYTATDDNVAGYSQVTVNVPPTLFRKLVDKTITEVTAEDLAGVTSVGAYAFNECRNLINVILPNSITFLGNSSFQSCRSLVNFKAPNVSEYGLTVFSSCVALKKFVFYPPTSSIANAVLNWCASLIAVVVDRDTPPRIEAITNQTPTYYVPDIPTYEQATNWARYTGMYAPLVDTTADLSNIDTNTYTKACARNNGNYDLYEYDGSQWNEI